MNLTVSSLSGESCRNDVYEKVTGQTKYVEDISMPGLFPEANCPTYTLHYVTGAHKAEVHVGVETGAVKAVRYVAVHDVDRVINQTGAEGQVDDYILPLIVEIPATLERVLNAIHS